MKLVGSLASWPVLAAWTLIFSCEGPPLTILPENLPNAIRGQTYQQELTADRESLAWTIAAGSLPPGLALDKRAGLIQGQPSQSGTYSFTVAAIAPGIPRRSGQRPYELTVVEPLTVQFSILPARVGEYYEDGPEIVGGVPPYDVSILYLPAGLDYDRATGLISGVPVVESSGQPKLELTVLDSGDPQQQTHATATLIVQPVGVSISTSQLEPGAIGEYYTVTLEADGGTQPYRWEVAEGLLPAGLRLDSRTGRISGTVTGKACTAEFVITVSDSGLTTSSDQRSFKLVVPVTILSTVLNPAIIGQSYAAVLAVAGGTPPYTWQVSGGALPAGLALDESAGVISGTTSAQPGTYTVSLQVTDSDDPPTLAEKEFAIEVRTGS